MSFKEYIKAVRASGHYAFTADVAIATLGISKNALHCAIYKLKKKKEIVSPADNFYVIVPPEYYSLGCLPAEELLPLLMRHWNVKYYVCGLSAALYHGAAHQKPQVFQVMTHHLLKNIKCGKISISFFYKKKLSPLQIEKRTVKTGFLPIASPELTALDLLTNRRLSGGLNHAATVLSELIEVIQPDQLMKIIESAKEHAWWQRLGYILEHIDVIESEMLKKTIKILRKYAKQQQLNWVPLAPELPTRGAARDEFWKIIANIIIETDE